MKKPDEMMADYQSMARSLAVPDSVKAPVDPVENRPFVRKPTSRQFSTQQKLPPLKSVLPKKPLHAAKKYDDAMKLQEKSLPSMEQIKARWKEQVGAAMLVWDRLTEKELLASEGHKKQLVDLLQEYHAFSRDEANKQVNSFFEKHMNASTAG